MAPCPRPVSIKRFPPDFGIEGLVEPSPSQAELLLLGKHLREFLARHELYQLRAKVGIDAVLRCGERVGALSVSRGRRGDILYGYQVNKPVTGEWDLRMSAVHLPGDRWS